MPILTQRSQLAAKIETVEGVAETLTGSNTFFALTPWFEPHVTVHNREIIRTSFSQLQGLSGKRSAEFGFQVELRGSGVAGIAPAWGDLLQACGFSETIVANTSVTYAPISTAIPSMTLAYYLDGVIGMLWGARGEVSISLTAGQPATLNFAFLGADFSVIDGSFLSGASYNNILPPVFLGAGLTLDAYTAQLETVKIALGNQLGLRTDLTKPSGHTAALLTGRRPVAEFDPEMTTVSSHDFFGHWKTGALVNFQANWGSLAGNQVVLSLPACRYRGLGFDDRQGIAVVKGEFELTGQAGDDEISLVLT